MPGRREVRPTRRGRGEGGGLARTNRTARLGTFAHLHPDPGRQGRAGADPRV